MRSFNAHLFNPSFWRSMGMRPPAITTAAIAKWPNLKAAIKPKQARLL